MGQYHNEQIFQSFHPRDNDQFSELSGFDLQDFIIMLDDYYLTLREELGLSHSSTFGLELEFENAKRNKIEEKLGKVFPNRDWLLKNDSSLCNGAEINSPILRDQKKSWEELEQVCSIVQPYASIEKKAGGHIHVGTQTLGDKDESWIHFIKLWSVYENILFRFLYGEYLSARPSLDQYAEPLAENFWVDYQTILRDHPGLSEIIYRITHTRHQAVNFKHVNRGNIASYAKNNTIEFRCPNGTLDPVIWQNNVNAVIKLLYYAKSSNFDDDMVEERYQKNKNKYYRLECYNEIYLEQALELADMLFHNNIDKIYFLKQYLKSFEICNNKKDYIKGKVLTK